MHLLNCNGRLVNSTQPVVQAADRSFRYGDGVFETIKIQNGTIQLADYHQQRLLSSLELLQINIPTNFTWQKLNDEIIDLCRQNQMLSLARIRLTVSSGNGGLFTTDGLNYIIESIALSENDIRYNEKGLFLGKYISCKKSMDACANLKSNNFLPYVMAAKFVEANLFDDCILLNTSGHIADTTIANIFMYKDGILATPSLDQGCVNGVMRQFLLEKMQANNIKFVEKPISIDDVASAEEVFLTNAIKGIRWVRQFENTFYTNELSKELYARFINPAKI